MRAGRRVHAVALLRTKKGAGGKATRAACASHDFFLEFSGFFLQSGFRVMGGHVAPSGAGSPVSQTPSVCCQFRSSDGSGYESFLHRVEGRGCGVSYLMELRGKTIGRPKQRRKLEAKALQRENSWYRRSCLAPQGRHTRPRSYPANAATKYSTVLETGCQWRITMFVLFTTL